MYNGRPVSIVAKDFVSYARKLLYNLFSVALTSATIKRKLKMSSERFSFKSRIHPGFLKDEDNINS